VTLDVDGDLRVAASAMDNAVVTNHDGKEGNRSQRETEELSHAQLHKVVRTTTIHEDRELVTVDSVVNTEGFGGAHAGQCIQAQQGRGFLGWGKW